MAETDIVPLYDTQRIIVMIGVRIAYSNTYHYE